MSSENLTGPLIGLKLDLWQKSIINALVLIIRKPSVHLLNMLQFALFYLLLGGKERTCANLMSTMHSSIALYGGSLHVSTTRVQRFLAF